MKISSIQKLKEGIIQKIAQNMPDIAVEIADEFCDRSIYSPLDKPVIVVYLKAASQRGVALGRESYENAMPIYGFTADIVIGFKLFCGSGFSSLNELSAKLAACILFDDDLDAQSFECQKISYNQELEVMEQECEGHFPLICTKGGA